MSTITHTISGINTSANISIKSRTNNVERCVSNCQNQVNGMVTNDVDISGLDKGVLHQIDIVVTEGSCASSGTTTLCCPATGGSILGERTPTQNSVQTYTVTGTDGTFREVGGNGAFTIVGGTNAYFQSTPSDGIAQIHVGTSEFSLCYRMSSCDIERTICVTITPAPVGCTLSVTNVSITC